MLLNKLACLQALFCVKKSNTQGADPGLEKGIRYFHNTWYLLTRDPMISN